VYLAIAGTAYFLGTGSYLQLMLPVLILVFTQPQLSACFSQLESQRNYRALSLVQPLATFLQVPFLLLLLWLAVAGSTTVVLSQALAAISILIALRYRWRSARTASEEPSGLAQPVFSSFVTALYMFNLASWVMATSDRYLVDHYLTRSDVGIYVINYAFWSIPYTVLNGWINSFARPRLYARAAHESWGRVFRVVLGTVSAGAMLAILGTGLIYLIGKPLAIRILGERYWHSEQLMLLLAGAHIFFVVGHTISTYFMALKRSHYVWITCLVAAVANIVANVLLLPKWGIIGAAATTFGGYALWAVLMLMGMIFYSRKLRDPASA
jgi:O-antigen/teichoic acid export membrane protein